MSGGSAPKMPSPAAMADANIYQAGETSKLQEYFNRRNTQANRPTQVTPWGSTTWSKPEFDEAAWQKQSGVSNTFDPTAWQAAHPQKKNESMTHYQKRMKIGEKNFGVKYKNKLAAAQANFKKNNINEWTQKTTLDPKLQEALDSQQNLQAKLSGIADTKAQQAQDQMGGTMDVSGLQPWQAMPTADAGVRQKVEDATYARGAARLDPRFATEQQSLETQLANQGLSPGTAAWNQAMDQFGRTKNDAYSSLTNDAITMGGDQMAQLFGMGTQAAQGNNALRGQQLQQQTYLRELPLNELQAMLQGQQVQMPQMPGFSQQGSNQLMGQPNMSDLMTQNYQSKLAGYNADQAQTGQAVGAGVGLIAALAAY